MSTMQQVGRRVPVGGRVRGLVAALAFGMSAGALAQGASFGTGCTYSGNTSAEGGLVGAIVNNAMSYGASNCGGGTVQSRDTVYGAKWTGENYFDYSFAQHAITASNATAGMGSLHAYSRSAAESTPKEWWYTDSNGDSHAIANEYLAYGRSSASASWSDRLVINQGTAAYGRIYVRYTLQLSGSEFVSEGGAAKADIFARFIVDDDRNVSDRTISLDAPGSFSFTAGYYPGTEVKLYGDLMATTEVRAGGRFINGNGIWVSGGYIAAAEAIANASNTAGFQVEVLTAGANYSTASGVSYITMVPEPSLGAMIGLGGALVVAVAKRRRRGAHRFA